MNNELIVHPDKGLPAIYINEPNDWFKFRTEHKKATKYSKISKSKQTDATEFYTPPIVSVDDAIVRTSDVIQKTISGLKSPFRINFAFPYDLITSEIYKAKLASSEPLLVDKFFSSLTYSDITQE